MTDRSQSSESTDVTSSAPLPSASRRQVLQVGGLGALGAAFLAACGSDAYETRPGVAGAGAPATSAPPTVPPTEPNSAQRATEEIELHTLASVETLLAETYRDHAARLADDDLRSAAERFAGDHEAAAARIAALSESGDADVANEDLHTRMVAPVERSLEPLLASDSEASRVQVNTSVLRLFNALETSLAATYVNSMNALTTPDLRGELASFGSASARRAAVLTDDPVSTAPTDALFPVRDLIPGSAFLGPDEEEAVEGDDAEGDDAES